MKPIFTLLAATLILFSSCSSGRKVSQTPDDLYYSPGSSSRAAAASSGEGSEYYSTAPSDQYVRMKTTDQARWSTFDDYNDYDSYYATPVGGSYYGGYSPYGFSPYGYGYGGYSAMSIGMGFWDPYFGWNSYFLWNTCYNPYFYNPYYGGSSVVIVKAGGVSASPFYNRLSAFNASNYHRNGVFASGNTNRYYRPASATTTSSSVYNSGTGSRYSNNTNNSFYRSNPGSTPRPSSGNSGSFSQPVRSFSPSSSGSSGGFGGGGGGGSFSRPAGGGFRH